LADRQRIVELFPPTHRRASVVTSRQRIVEVGGGCSAPFRVEVMVRAAVPLRQQPFSNVGLAAAIRWILAGNARPPTLREARPMAVPNRQGPGMEQATDTSPRDKWRWRPPFVSTMRCRVSRPSGSTMRCRSAATLQLLSQERDRAGGG